MKPPTSMRLPSDTGPNVETRPDVPMPPRRPLASRAAPWRQAARRSPRRRGAGRPAARDQDVVAVVDRDLAGGGGAWPSQSYCASIRASAAILRYRSSAARMVLPNSADVLVTTSKPLPSSVLRTAGRFATASTNTRHSADAPAGAAALPARGNPESSTAPRERRQALTDGRNVRSRPRAPGLDRAQDLKLPVLHVRRKRRRQRVAKENWRSGWPENRSWPDCRRGIGHEPYRFRPALSGIRRPDDAWCSGRSCRTTACRDDGLGVSHKIGHGIDRQFLAHKEADRRSPPRWSAA